MKNLRAQLLHTPFGLITTFVRSPRQKRFHRLLRILLSLALTLTCLGTVFPTGQDAFAATTKTVLDVLGVSRAALVNHLKSHENDTFYLTTPYRPYDWRSPNGDPAFNGGTPGMNCTGFVWYALVASGANPAATPALTGWVDLIRDNNMECYYYNNKAAMLASGVLVKGDIIWMFDNDSGGMDGISDFHHIGIFWGDSPSDDKLWHSYADDTATWTGSNRISPIMPKASNCLYVVIKADNSGAVGVSKKSSNAALSDGNPCYSLKGAKYGVFSDGACTKQVQTIVTDETGNGASGATLVPGDYWVKEIAASPGYALDTTAYKVTLTLDACNNQAVPKAAVWEAPQSNPVDIVVRKIDAQTG
ncbi:MAG: prealbumin-like fold domain-containing protein, partial [Eggerthellaceae bacterium]|nr:prealbumin-like fold domain-containing protein [Eggerthellaceae bacterium]